MQELRSVLMRYFEKIGSNDSHESYASNKTLKQRGMQATLRKKEKTKEVKHENDIKNEYKDSMKRKLETKEDEKKVPDRFENDWKATFDKQMESVLERFEMEYGLI